MISISSDLAERLQKVIDKYKSLKAVMEDFANAITQQMAMDMTMEIEHYRDVWAEPNTKLAYLPPIAFDIQYTGRNSVKIEVGSNIPKFLMADGDSVNPVYFIEYGFGIVGEENPVENADKYDWQYNINDHENYWFFRGVDGRTEKSKGVPGISFMYNTIQRYKDNWEQIFQKFIKENS